VTNVKWNEYDDSLIRRRRTDRISESPLKGMGLTLSATGCIQK
jgi:hypothetical protein